MEMSPRRRGAGTRPAMAERQRDSCDSLMKSEQRSPIMTAGAWVLPRMTVGITDVSAMRSPSTPCTRSFGSTTPSAGDPIRAVHDG